MVIAIGILALLVIALVIGILKVFADSRWGHCRIDILERKVTGLSGRINTVADEGKISREQLVDDLWQRASVEVDQEIEKARERGRGF